MLFQASINIQNRIRIDEYVLKKTQDLDLLWVFKNLVLQIVVQPVITSWSEHIVAVPAVIGDFTDESCCNVDLFKEIVLSGGLGVDLVVVGKVDECCISDPVEAFSGIWPQEKWFIAIDQGIAVFDCGVEVFV